MLSHIDLLFPCQADCFIDGKDIRPIQFPNKLVWRYFEIKDGLSGALEERQFMQCPCGCQNLMATPPAMINVGHSIKSRKQINKRSWFSKSKDIMVRFLLFLVRALEK